MICSVNCMVWFSCIIDESRFEAFGWSLPKELQPSMSPPPPPDGEIDHDGGSHVSQDRSGIKSVPVLTHCSPVSGVEDQVCTRICCEISNACDVKIKN